MLVVISKTLHGYIILRLYLLNSKARKLTIIDDDLNLWALKILSVSNIKSRPPS